jgi:hypothetical protein
MSAAAVIVAASVPAGARKTTGWVPPVGGPEMGPLFEDPPTPWPGGALCWLSLEQLLTKRSAPHARATSTARVATPKSSKPVQAIASAGLVKATYYRQHEPPGVRMRSDGLALEAPWQ